MAVVSNGVVIPSRKPKYSENILPVSSVFNDVLTINKTAGTDFSVVQQQTNYKFEGTKGIQSYNDSTVTFLTYNFGDALTTTIPKTGDYIFSFEMLHLDTIVFDNQIVITVFVNAVPMYEIVNSLVFQDVGIQKDKWHTFAQSFTFSQNDVIDFTFKHVVDPTSFIGTSTIYFDAPKLELDDRNLQGRPSIYSKNPISTKREAIGVYDYNDLATQTTPLNYTGSDPFYLTNDGLGVFTNKTYKLTGVNDVYNVSINAFDFTVLELGDTVDIRLDLDITTSAPSQTVKIIIELGIGSFPVGTYQLNFAGERLYKTVKLYPNETWFNSIYMGDLTTRDNDAKFIFESSNPATITVNGWYCKVSKRLV